MISTVTIHYFPILSHFRFISYNHPQDIPLPKCRNITICYYNVNLSKVALKVNITLHWDCQGKLNLIHSQQRPFKAIWWQTKLFQFNDCFHINVASKLFYCWLVLHAGFMVLAIRNTYVDGSPVPGSMCSAAINKEVKFVKCVCRDQYNYNLFSF